MYASAALVAALRSQLPDLKHTHITIRPSEGAVAWIEWLESTYGKEALEIERNPALAHIACITWGAGNDLSYNVKRVKSYYSLQSLPSHTVLAYAKLNHYAQAFGCSIWCGKGNEALYQGKEWGVTRKV